MYEIDARKAERAFIRKLEKTGGFTTANGKANMYQGKQPGVVFLKTEKSRKPLAMHRTKLRAAISFTFYTRTVTRKDVEKFSRYSSALLGMLHVIFEQIAKLHKTPTGLVRLTLKGIRYFFAGVDRAVRDMEVAVANGAKFVLMSYYHLRTGLAQLAHVRRLGVKILLDSGAFTLWKAQEKGKAVEPISLPAYADFIEEHRDVLYAWFNLDVVGDAAASRENAEYLKARGLASIEVWHVGGSVKELNRIVQEDHAVIAIGGSVGMSEKRRARKFRWVFKLFPEQNFHFLGGSSKLLNVFPWFSADSTGWIAGRKYGAVLDEKGQRPAKQDEDKRDWDGIACMAYNARYFARLEQRCS